VYVIEKSVEVVGSGEKERAVRERFNGEENPVSTLYIYLIDRRLFSVQSAKHCRSIKVARDSG
jgi:hypothetical protein